MSSRKFRSPLSPSGTVNQNPAMEFPGMQQVLSYHTNSCSAVGRQQHTVDGQKARRRRPTDAANPHAEKPESLKDKNPHYLARPA